LQTKGYAAKRQNCQAGNKKNVLKKTIVQYWGKSRGMLRVLTHVAEGSPVVYSILVLHQYNIMSRKLADGLAGEEEPADAGWLKQDKVPVAALGTGTESCR